MNAIDLAGRAAIVTGAGRGIGYEIADRLLRSGARVSLWDLDGGRVESAAATLALLGEVETVALDITDSAAVDAATAAAVSTWGQLDILVNNAGIAGKIDETVNQSDEDWRTVIDVVLTGTFNCSRAALPHMLAREHGRIVNIASVSGKEGSPRMPAYSAAKAGVMGLTKSMGRELAKTGVLVNCITPAAVGTELVRVMPAAHQELMLRNIPMGRYGTVAEIAALAAWLASEECSFSTGGVFDASGGRSSH